jgi:CheY-like chemotaxis protein
MRDLKSSRILCVDDENDALEVLQIALQKAGYQVVTAEDGIQALNILKEDNRFELVITDRMMPNLDGLTLCNKIKQDVSLRDIPVVFQTALGREQDFAEGYSAGAFYYLAKPFNNAQLLNVTKRALEKKKYADLLSSDCNFYQMKREMVRFGMQSFTNVGFKFRTLARAKGVAQAAALCFRDPFGVVAYIYELLVNAIEHGNAGIELEEKKWMIEQGIFDDEVDKRLMRPENHKKFVSVEVSKKNKKTIMKIKDQGNGFDWQSMMQPPTSEEALSACGKGIAMVKTVFDKLEYEDDGRTAVIVG